MNVPVRVLDPVTAVIAPGQSAVGSTAYVPDRLLGDPSAHRDGGVTPPRPGRGEVRRARPALPALRAGAPRRGRAPGDPAMPGPP